MRKYWWLIIPVLLIAAGFIPFTVEKKIRIADTLNTVAKQTTVPANIAKWFEPFNNLPKPSIAADNISGNGEVLRIKIKDPVSIVLTYEKSGAEKLFLLEVLSVAEKRGVADVLLSYNSNFLKKITGESEMVKNAEKSLDYLKSYIEIPEIRYGYKIEHTLVVDTTFLVMSGHAAPENFQTQVSKTYEVLEHFAEKNNGGFNGVRIFNKKRNADGNIDFSCAIAVTKSFPLQPAAGISYEKMPYQKNLLKADFTGPYKEVEKVHKALTNYAEDNNLTTMAIAFEKWTDGSVTVGDEDLVRVSVFLPVF